MKLDSYLPIILLVLSLTLILFSIIVFKRAQDREKWKQRQLAQQNIQRSILDDVCEDVRDLYRLGNNDPKSPIIIVPGLGGSALFATWYLPDSAWNCTERQKEPYRVWVSAQAVAPDFISSCWKAKMMNRYSNGHFSTLPGVQRTAWRDNGDRLMHFGEYQGMKLTSDFGGIDGVAVLNCTVNFASKSAYMFYNVIKAFCVNKGYKPARSILGAPYDFGLILDPNYQAEYFRRLKLLIEYSVGINGGKKAHLLCHSLGCTTTLLFLHTMTQQWKDQYINTYVPIAGPFAGSPKALRTVLSGAHSGLGILCDTFIIKTRTCDKWFAELERSLAGALWMIQDNKALEGIPIVTVKGAGTFKSSPDDLKRLYALAKYPEAGQVYDQIVKFINMYEPPRVRTLAIVGKTNKPTECAYAYENTKFMNPRIFPETDAYMQMKATGKMSPLQRQLAGDIPVSEMRGDSTVVYMSLRVPFLWTIPGGEYENRDGARVFETKFVEFQGGDEFEHKAIVDSRKVIETLLRELN
jgi:hypothetical protein